jgi:2-phosphosulfolactate phosphatase
MPHSGQFHKVLGIFYIYRVPAIQTALSPLMLQFHQVEGKAVVVIDILRATSSMVVAFAHGAKRIIPVSTPEESLSFAPLGFICAAERDGKPVEGFDIGNSPYSYMEPAIRDASIAITTTNGTKAISMSRQAGLLMIGSFLNKTAVCRRLEEYGKDIILLCSGWKNNFNLEDTLFAGAICDALSKNFTIADDASIAAMDLYQQARSSLGEYILKSSHAHRFRDLGITRDIAFCMQEDLYDIVPVLKGEFLVV